MNTTVLLGPKARYFAQLELQATGGKFFTVTFKKRNGHRRMLNCRTMPLPPHRLAEDRANNLLTVAEGRTGAYRRINLDTVESLSFKGSVEVKP